MQTAPYAVPLPSSTAVNNSVGSGDPKISDALANYQIIRRNGSVVAFEPHKIAVAMMMPFWPSMAPRALLRPACAKPSTP